MPVAKHPRKRDFYVYRFEVNGIPFYVGHGRDERASDRVRYVRRCLKNRRAGKQIRMKLCEEVIAALLAAHPQLDIKYIRGFTQHESKVREKREIERLLARGYLLANVMLNPKPPKSHAPIVRALLGDG